MASVVASGLCIICETSTWSLPRVPWTETSMAAVRRQRDVLDVVAERVEVGGGKQAALCLERRRASLVCGREV